MKKAKRVMPARTYPARKRPEELHRKTSISLSPETEYLVQKLQERWKTSFSRTFDQAVRRACQDEGIFLPPALGVRSAR